MGRRVDRTYGEMRANERLARIREIECTVAKLQEKGWRMEAVEHLDEEDQPFRTVIRMSCSPKSHDKSLA